ncbi:MAG: hypothetical protein P4M08_06345 [Oligoflexia bacterium]|nr:hypothetical protein [Oligoflexia bacterium]
MKKPSLIFALAVLAQSVLAFHASDALAFPEMIRAGYVNCTSCHISPNGGGLLNEYGRNSSADVLSTWGGENEAKPFYGAFKQPDWIDTGAFAKAVQTAQNNSAMSNGYFWYMQGDVEAAVTFGSQRQWTADFAVGISPDVLNSVQVPGASPLVSRRQYLMYRLNDTTTIRAGKFVADYGVYFPDHTIPTRQGIGFDEGMETYNLEYSYQGEKFSGSITADFGRIDNPSLQFDKGAMATGAMALGDSSKVGYSVFYGTENSNTRELTGPYALLGFTRHFYLLGEADLQFTQPSSGSSTRGLASFERLGYEPIQGLHLYWMEQTYVYDVAGNFNPTTINPMYGIMTNRLIGTGPGIYWYPRPHFYIQLEVQQQFSPNYPSAQTYGFIVGSIYL